MRRAAVPSLWHTGSMDLPRLNDSFQLFAGGARQQASRPRRVAVEERDWYASSRELLEGLVVTEWTDTLPADLDAAGP